MTEKIPTFEYQGKTYYITDFGVLLEGITDPVTNSLSFKLSSDVKEHNGYKYFRNIPMHNIIYEAYKGKIPQGMEINHKNINRGDNRLENLEPTTHQENCSLRRNNVQCDTLPPDAIEFWFLYKHNAYTFIGKNHFYSKSQNTMYQKINDRYKITYPLLNNNKNPTQYFKIDVFGKQ